MQTEYLYPSVSDRKSPDEWAEQGSLDVTARATKKAEQILASHFPDHIPEAVDVAIRERSPIRLARADAASRQRGREAGPGLGKGRA